MTCDYCSYSEEILVQQSNSKSGPVFGGLIRSHQLLSLRTQDLRWISIWHIWLTTQLSAVLWSFLSNDALEPFALYSFRKLLKLERNWSCDSLFSRATGQLYRIIQFSSNEKCVWASVAREVSRLSTLEPLSIPWVIICSKSLRSAKSFRCCSSTFSTPVQYSSFHSNATI